MSLRVLTLVWDRFPEGGSKLLTMLALADWSSDDGSRIYASKETIAAKIRMSPRQTIRIVDELVAAGFLQNLTPDNAGGRRRSSRYRIALETLTNCPIIRPEQAVDKSKETMTNPTETMTPVTVNCDIAMSHEPVEPLYNRKEPEQVKAQRDFLEWMRKVPNADPVQIAEAEKMLDELILLHNLQPDLLEVPK